MIEMLAIFYSTFLIVDSILLVASKSSLPSIEITANVSNLKFN